MDIAYLPSHCTYGHALAQRDCGEFALSVGVHMPGEAIPAHRHQDEYQWCLALEGGFEEFVGANSEQCGAGSLLIRPPDCIHADRFGGMRGVCLNLFLRGSWLAAQGFGSLRDTYAHHRTRRLWGLGCELAAELKRTDSSSGLAAEGLVSELLATAARLADSALAGYPRWLGAVLDQIEAEPAGELNLAALARSASVSAGHLARTFRATFGRSVGAYARERRLERAAAFLRSGRASLADVSSAVGFCDQAHFTRAFKAQFGVTPAAFRDGLHMRKA